MRLLIPDVHYGREFADAACAFLMEFRITDNYPPFVLTRDEYFGACDAGYIKYLDYYSPGYDSFAIAMDSRAFGSNMITKMRQAYSDFKRGWAAASK